MNFITSLFNLEDYNVTLIVISTLLKKRHYIFCTTSDEEISIKVIVNLLIKKMFRLYKLSSFIVFNRES